MEQNGQDCYAFLVKEEVDRVRIDDIDIYKLPRWLEGIFEEVERICYETLEEESEFYKGVLEETHELLDKYDFLSTIADHDEIREPMNLSITEVHVVEILAFGNGSNVDGKGADVFVGVSAHVGTDGIVGDKKIVCVLFG